MEWECMGGLFVAHPSGCNEKCTGDAIGVHVPAGRARISAEAAPQPEQAARSEPGTPAPGPARIVVPGRRRPCPYRTLPPGSLRDLAPFFLVFRRYRFRIRSKLGPGVGGKDF